MLMGAICLNVVIIKNCNKKLKEMYGLVIFISCHLEMLLNITANSRVLWKYLK